MPKKNDYQNLMKMLNEWWEEKEALERAVRILNHVQDHDYITKGMFMEAIIEVANDSTLSETEKYQEIMKCIEDCKRTLSS